MANVVTGAPGSFRATSLLQRLRQSFKLEGSRRDDHNSACSATDARKKDYSLWPLPRYGPLCRSSSKGSPPTLLEARQRDASPMKAGSPHGEGKDARELSLKRRDDLELSGMESDETCLEIMTDPSSSPLKAFAGCFSAAAQKA